MKPFCVSSQLFLLLFVYLCISVSFKCKSTSEIPFSVLCFFLQKSRFFCKTNYKKFSFFKKIRTKFSLIILM